MFGKDKPVKPPKNEPFITGNFNISQTLGASGRTLQMAGYLYYGEDQGSIEARLRMMSDIMDKEKARSEIPELEAKREQMIRGLGQARDVLAELEEKNKTDKLSSNERMQLQNMRVNIGKVSEEIDKGTEAIAEAKKRAGVGA